MRKFKNIQFKDLTEKKKDQIIKFITDTGMPIKDCAIKFRVGVSTLNRLFDERFNKRQKKIDEIKKSINFEQIKK